MRSPISRVSCDSLVFGSKCETLAIFRSLEVARQIQPHPARSSQIQPDPDRWSQMVPDPARSSQMEPDGTRWSQIQPDGARWSQMEPDGARSSQMEPDGARSSQIQLGVKDLCPRPRVAHAPGPAGIRSSSPGPLACPRPILVQLSIQL